MVSAQDRADVKPIVTHSTVKTVDALLGNVAITQTDKADATRDAVVVGENTKATDDVRSKELLQGRVRHARRKAVRCEGGQCMRDKCVPERAPTHLLKYTLVLD